MAQNAEAQDFLRRLGELPNTPGIDLDPAITPSLQDEADLRRLFATDRTNARLKDPYVGLVDVFGQNTDRIKKIHARAVKDDEDLRKYHVMPLEDDRRKKDGELSMTSSLEDFRTRWAIFSEGALSQLTNWNNVIAAGGSVLACLAPLPEHVAKQGSKRAIRKYYHSEAYPASDVDLFLYGLTPEQAEEKCIEIYNAVRDSVPWEVCAIRTKNAVSIHCQYPYRPVQIVLRIYQSPAEILAGFDVDAACVAYDGTRVLAAPRAIMALMTQCNRVAMDRRSPSYEVRLAKYAARGFEIHVPDLRREDFDPTIFERALTRVAGLARLLVLEKLGTQEARDGYINQRRQMRGRPNLLSRRQMRRGKRLRGVLNGGDLKAASELGGLQMSDYDVLFHIPYGPGFNAKTICKMVYQTDLGMNSTFNPKNKGHRLHRHSAFFGNMNQALGDCCHFCPLPETDEEKEMFEKDQEQFLTGRVTFIQDDPGRQSITGSFHPIDSGAWSEQAYLKPLVKLFSLIVSHNRSACNDFLKRNAEAIKARDHLGRTPLQFALLCSAEDICLDLIEQGARMTSRMVDGRCSLHLAAQMGLPKVVKALLERSERNKLEKEAKEKEAKEKEKNKSVKVKDQDDEVRFFGWHSGSGLSSRRKCLQIRDSSEDDWSSEDNEDEDYEEAKKKVDPKGDPVKAEEDPLEESEGEPDILDIDAPDWDQCLTALGYAIISGSFTAVQVLIAAGADCKTPRQLSDSYQTNSTFYPLALTALTPDESVGAQIAEHLITVGGASCSAADSCTLTVFHRLVSLNKPQIIETILNVDPTAKAASRFLYTNSGQSAIHPIASAFANGQRAMVAVLLAYAGSRAFIDLETYDRSVPANPDHSSYLYGRAGELNWKIYTLQPLKAALADHNDLYRLVLDLEPESANDCIPPRVLQYPTTNPTPRSMLEFLRSAVEEMMRRSEQATTQSNAFPGYIPPTQWRGSTDLSDTEISEMKGWDAYAIALEKRKKEVNEANLAKVPVPYMPPGLIPYQPNRNAEEEMKVQATKLIPYFQQAVEEFEKAGARTWDELHPHIPLRGPNDPNAPTQHSLIPDILGAIPMRMAPSSPSLFGLAPTVLPTQQLTPMPGISGFMPMRMAVGPPSVFGSVPSLFGPAPSLFGPAPTVLPVDEKTKPFKRYSLFKSTDWGEDYPGTHLISLYDELYEACWNGDNDKIRALCLPLPDDPSPPPSGTSDFLQVTARVKYTEQMNDHAKGYTPLFVALRARKWDTARLILEIAQQQLTKEKDDEESKQVKRFGNVIMFGDDDDDDDANSNASDETEKRPAGYTNLVKRFHTVSVKVKPNHLLSYEIKCIVAAPGSDPFARLADPITLAVLENDVEAFTQIADMMEHLEEPMPISGSLLFIILANDSPDMLDIYIRRTGEGLSLPQPKAKEATDDKAEAQRQNEDDDEHKIYLGLDVNGKKRKDLARRDDPNAHYAPYAPHAPYDAGTGNKIPLAWNAASKHATAILEYLSSPRAIEAYRYYAETSKTKLAKRLAEVLQNTDDFPKLVGFSVTQLAETPVLAVLWNPPQSVGIPPTFGPNPSLPTLKPDRMLPTLKKLMELQPRLTADGLRLQVKPNRMSAFLLLCSTNGPMEVFDWMLANGADPLVREERGWNILHLMFNSYKINWAFIEHAFAKLPADVIQTMMAQQSRTQRNTPFAIAVKKGNLKLVEFLLRTAKSAVVPTLLLRDCTGATPLHLAILKGWSKMVSLLVDDGPPEMLYMENGVGSTPLEVTRLQFLTQTLRGLVSPLNPPNGLETNFGGSMNLTPEPGMRDRDEEEVRSLRRVINRIKSSGALDTKPKLLEVLSNFADRSEQEFATWMAQRPKDEMQPTSSGTNNEIDTCDVKATFDVFSKAVAEVHQRQLVHLRDVQLAVLSAVESQMQLPSRVGLLLAHVEGFEEEEPVPVQRDINYSAILGFPSFDSDVAYHPQFLHL
ncbi:hypothetical protein FRC04_003952 [Tulasnella sp. 424]|nr:hypothetical protein FRC04_003952 [Tulasnella sp. 424]KAG8965188.1 hypothetical protein FRC05_003331 [Tulasnella sp. 425]